VSARVLITGAAGGIGSATVDALRSKGAEVIGLDLEADVAREIIACDVRDQTSVDTAVAEAIDLLGGLDVLINNAGIGLPQASGERPDASADAVIDVNLLGPWRVTAAALPALRASGGRVVNVASGLAYMAIPMAPAYCMAKRGLTAYSDSLRIEHADAISVTTVYPGYIRTPIHDAAAEHGLSLEGTVPAERVSDAARTLVRASLGPPARDLATTRAGGVGYFLLRHLPRSLVDRLVARRSRAVIAGTLGSLPSTRSSHARQAVKTSEEAS
jgi:NAD(P)-dependent dehydrogenase (short-subunit alcohol dehydrogenase family)